MDSSEVNVRVQGAKDALALLETNAVIARKGSYLDSWVLHEVGLTWGAEGHRQVCEFTRKLKKCSACAIGTLFVAMVNKHNDLQINDYRAASLKTGACHVYLQRFFEPKQLGLIEAAFEMSNVQASIKNCTLDEVRSAIKFGRKHQKSHDRMVAILNNIIENDGEFVP